MTTGSSGVASKGVSPSGGASLLGSASLAPASAAPSPKGGSRRFTSLGSGGPGLPFGRRFQGKYNFRVHSAAINRHEAHPRWSGARAFLLILDRHDGWCDNGRVLPPGGVLQGDNRALQTPPPLVVGKVGLAGPASCRPPAVQGVPRSLPVGSPSRSLGHAYLQAGFSSFANEHFKLVALAHHEGMGPGVDFVRVAGWVA